MKRTLLSTVSGLVFVTLVASAVVTATVYPMTAMAEDGPGDGVGSGPAGGGDRTGAGDGGASATGIGGDANGNVGGDAIGQGPTGTDTAATTTAAAPSDASDDGTTQGVNDAIAAAAIAAVTAADAQANQMSQVTADDNNVNMISQAQAEADNNAAIAQGQTAADAAAAVAAANGASPGATPSGGTTATTAAAANQDLSKDLENVDARKQIEAARVQPSGEMADYTVDGLTFKAPAEPKNDCGSDASLGELSMKAAQQVKAKCQQEYAEARAAWQQSYYAAYDAAKAKLASGAPTTTAAATATKEDAKPTTTAAATTPAKTNEKPTPENFAFPPRPTYTCEAPQIGMSGMIPQNLSQVACVQAFTEAVTNWERDRSAAYSAHMSGKPIPAHATSYEVDASKFPNLSTKVSFSSIDEYREKVNPNFKQPVNNCGVGFVISNGIDSLTPEQKAQSECLDKLRMERSKYDAELNGVIGELQAKQRAAGGDSLFTTGGGASRAVFGGTVTPPTAQTAQQNTAATPNNNGRPSYESYNCGVPLFTIGGTTTKEQRDCVTRYTNDVQKWDAAQQKPSVDMAGFKFPQQPLLCAHDWQCAKESKELLEKWKVDYAAARSAYEAGKPLPTTMDYNAELVKILAKYPLPKDSTRFAGSFENTFSESTKSAWLEAPCSETQHMMESMKKVDPNLAERMMKKCGSSVATAAFGGTVSTTPTMKTTAVKTGLGEGGSVGGSVAETQVTQPQAATPVTSTVASTADTSTATTPASTNKASGGSNPFLGGGGVGSMGSLPSGSAPAVSTGGAGGSGGTEVASLPAIPNAIGKGMTGGGNVGSSSGAATGAPVATSKSTAEKAKPEEKTTRLEVPKNTCGVPLNFSVKYPTPAESKAMNCLAQYRVAVSKYEQAKAKAAKKQAAAKAKAAGEKPMTGNDRIVPAQYQPKTVAAY